MKKCLVVLSGGQDSTTCLFWAKQHYNEVHAITFNYGQRHVIEIEAARKVGQMAGVASHEIVDVPGILAGKSFLTDLSAPVEKFESLSQMEHHNAFKENKLDSSFVPMRNALFLTLAANRAYVKDCSTMLTGVTAADFAEYGEFSWEWLGGFVDAEGHFSEVNKSTYSNLRLSISQKDPELLVRLGQWVKGQLPNVTYSLDSETLYFGVKALREMAPLLMPNLHSPLRRSQAISRGEGLADLPENVLSDGYVVGFWEGDGGCYSNFSAVGKKKQYQTAHFDFQFYQKDPTVLEKIKDYLGSGSIYQRNTQNKIWVFVVSDGPVRERLLTRFRKHFCVLGSFKKITKSRHKIDMAAGGFNPPYPDCTPDFIRCTERTIAEALRVPGISPIEITTPLMFLTKSQSVLLARDLPGCWEALAYSHTSYDGKYPPTDMNHSNVLRAAGFEQAGLPDPLVLRAHREGLMALPATANYTDGFIKEIK